MLRISALCVVAACGSEISNPDAGVPIETPVEVSDLAVDAFPSGITTDGYLVYRRWSGQGLVLEVMPATGGPATQVARITPEDTIMVSGGVVGWWSGATQERFHYWSAASGTRENVTDRSCAYLLYGSEDGSHVVFATNAIPTPSGLTVVDLVFTSTTVLDMAPVATGILIGIGGEVSATITNDDRLVMLATATDGSQRFSYRDGVRSFAFDTSGMFGMDVDRYGTTALLFGSDSTVVDLRTQRVTSLGGRVAGFLIDDGHGAIVRDATTPGLVRLTFGESLTRTPLFAELGPIEMAAIEPTANPRRFGLWSTWEASVEDRGDYWVADLARNEVHKLELERGEVWDPTFSESGGSLVFHRQTGLSNGDNGFIISDIYARSSRTGEQRVILHDVYVGMLVPAWSRESLSTPFSRKLGENVVAVRSYPCTGCMPELWYANAETGASGQITSGSAQPPTLFSGQYTFGRRLFYTDEVDARWMMRAVELP